MNIKQLKFNWLSENRREVKAFYRQYMPYARLNRKEAMAVFQLNSTQIVASVRFRPIGKLLLMTGLLVDPTFQGMGLAKKLILKTCVHLDEKPIYLFTEASLTDFYQCSGFMSIQQGPNDIMQLLLKYQKQGKPLLLMQYVGNNN
ncbi:GNAT family N-acetyltransferase [uncultured Shewanella sp.]|uniref:GNAT family N-acetyltransferase n=1 Tax=uncultured Shewanella sp. TaxID=173975 RepID=UPI002612B269|nr:GNAT family N-acetyltransferase [uncultured Shewanella sp.]